LKQRKTTRYHDGDHDSAGEVFLTLCTKDKKCILSRIVGTGVRFFPASADSDCGEEIFDGPRVELTRYGRTVDKYINQLNNFYDHIIIDSYVIMPNHVHILLVIKEDAVAQKSNTAQNTVVAKFVSTLKRFCNKEFGENIWQYRSYDHIIRDWQDYDAHLRYIDENPLYWKRDTLFSEE